MNQVASHPAGGKEARRGAGWEGRLQQEEGAGGRGWQRISSSKEMLASSQAIFLGGTTGPVRGITPKC